MYVARENVPTMNLPITAAAELRCTEWPPSNITSKFGAQHVCATTAKFTQNWFTMMVRHLTYANLQYTQMRYVFVNACSHGSLRAAASVPASHGSTHLKSVTAKQASNQATN